jgi:4-amino-4-deoxy-L-arabinose transferase-like glycosyltransferase
VNKLSIFRKVALILISVGLIKNFLFIIPTINKPAPIERLTIDSISYIKGANSIIEEKNILDLKDIYHSPGFQIFLAGVLFASGKRIAIVKILFCVFTVLTTLLTIYMGEKYIRKGVGYVAGIFSAFSLSFTFYSAIIQYEILATFLILIASFLSIKSLLTNKKIIFFLTGIFFSFICMISIKFIIVPLMIVCYFVINLKFGKKTLLAIILFLIGTFLIIAPWAIHQSLRNKKIVFVQSSYVLSRFKMYNNPNSEGRNFPCPTTIEPSGFDFIIKQPIRFLWLTKERFLYFWNFKDDIWKISFPWQIFIHNKTISDYFYRVIDKLISIIYFLSFILGVILLFLRGNKLKLLFNQASIFYFIIIGIMGVPLLVSASPRFCIPMLPYVYMFQAYFVINSFEFIKLRNFR